jgi:hypothetical protein
MRAFYPAGAPQLAGFASPKSYAAHPVWKGSAREEITFAPMPKREAVKIWHDARRFESQTRGGGGKGCIHYNGKISRVGLMVLQALLFDFLNYKSGRLDPCYSSIAEKAGVSISSVYRSLVRLRDAGIINWVKRCSASYDDGRYILAQDSNAYGVAPPSQWKGYRRPPDPPPPDPGAWGASPPLPPVLSQAAALLAAGDNRQAQAIMESDPGDKLAAAVARFGRARRDA